uniref:Uncharacterized protein n=1 Tax=Trypanosoma vivax (strain Y486) TaxID=1055687 RepID=G0TUB2_TRYVY|nr:conserved hypothetical protein [Trypanosoma vivax Y486]
MTSDELRREFVSLCCISASLAEESASLQADISALCKKSVKFQQSAEIEEDKLTNQLLRRLQNEELQKHRFHDQILREERARQQIMDQITEVRRQTAELEGQLTYEHESQRMLLQRKLVDVARKMIELERQLLNERQEHLSALTTQLAYIKSESIGAGADGLNEGRVPLANHSLLATNHVPVDALQSSSHVNNDERSSVVLSSEAAAPSAQMTPGSSTDDMYGTVVRLEEQLKHLRKQHEAAMAVSTTNQTLCTELGRSLESIQQAAFVDKARTLKLREELQEAKRRVAELGESAQKCGCYFPSDDSSGIMTPKGSSFTEERRREITTGLYQRCPSGCVQPSYSASESGEEFRPG